MLTQVRQIRFLIPVITIAILLVVITFSYLSARHLTQEQSAISVTTKVSDKLHYLQGVLEHLMERDLDVIVHQLISGVSSEPDLGAIILTDTRGKVIASNHYADINLHWRNTNIDFDQFSLNRLNKRSANVQRRGKFIDGYASICPQQASSTLRSNQCGFIFYRVNLQYHYQQLQDSILHQTYYFAIGMFFTVAIIFGLLRFYLVKPLMGIIHRLHQFNLGARETRLPVYSKNEITELAKTINLVLDKMTNDESTLKEKEEKLRVLFNSTIDAIFTIDSSGTITSANPAVEQLFGYSQEELFGKNISLLMPDQHRMNHDGYISQYLETGKGRIVGHIRELSAVTKTGNALPIELSVTRMFINDKIEFIGVVRDISEQHKLREAMTKINKELFTSNLSLKQLSKTDPLTSLANKGYFHETLRSEVRRAIRQNSRLSLIMLDVDHFKAYNDFYGHQKGDQCLRLISKQMKTCFQRAGELPARYGGEEFAVILPNTESEYAENMAKKLQNKISELKIEHQQSDTAQHVTVSIGIATLNIDANQKISDKDLIDAADKALYEAKAHGRNRIELAEISFPKVTAIDSKKTG
ncbi:MAG: diguanylate cyclase [Gammaproteobacteria bacterium]|nr:diguanylate cyclase [Gammaproteobacteria bacterium]MDH5729734.1 diguanylate cyclase [Gammaproteobacteria bacterium]